MAVLGSPIFGQEKLVGDVPHCRIQFSVPFMTFAKQSGVFPDINIAWKKTKSDFSDSNVNFTADVKTLNTNHPDRNAHLQQENFFNAAKYPKISFVSTSSKKDGKNTFTMKGDLTIKGVTLNRTFNVVLEGETVDPMTQEQLYIFSINGSFKRLDFGVGTDFPEAAIGNEVTLDATVIVKKEV